MIVLSENQYKLVQHSAASVPAASRQQFVQAVVDELRRFDAVSDQAVQVAIEAVTRRLHPDSRDWSDMPEDTL